MTSTTINESNTVLNPSMEHSPGLLTQTLGQQDFLRLMVAHIQNKAPVQSSVNGEYLSQIAQFSSNDTLSKMQESMQQMENSLQSNQALQASALVGRKVLIHSDCLKLESEGDVNIVIDVPPGTHSVTACIYNESGALLKTMELETQESGLFEFIWDGLGHNDQRLVSDNYKIAVQGLCMGMNMSFKTLITAHVNSVSFGQNGEGLKLNLAGSGAISLDQVRQITL